MKHFGNSIFVAEDYILRAQIKLVAATHLIEDLLSETKERQNMTLGEIHNMIKEADTALLSTAITELDDTIRAMNEVVQYTITEKGREYLKGAGENENSR